MHAFKRVFLGTLGTLLAFNAFAQSYIIWGNTTATPIYTNDCNGNIGLIRTRYRFGLYLGPLGADRNGLTLVALGTNSGIAGVFGTTTPFPLPAPYVAGTTIAFQIRGEAIVDSGDFAQSGESEIGYITPTAPPLPAPKTFGTNSGQVGSFKLRGLCPPYAARQLPDGPYIITRVVPGVSLSWTNAWPTSPNNYRIRMAEFVTGPWTNLADVAGTNAEMTFSLPSSATPSRFYSIEGTNASPAQPFGSWHYQALDKSGTVLAAGILSFTSSVPLLGDYKFTRIQNFTLHPEGTNAFASASLTSSNTVEVHFTPEFRIRGQMEGSYWAGDWFATEPVVGGGTRSHGARFIAQRRN